MRVKDEYRSNPLSLEPGGVEVMVTEANGGFKIYDKVKNPKAFANRVVRNAESLPEGDRPIKIETKGEVLWEI